MLALLIGADAMDAPPKHPTDQSLSAFGLGKLDDNAAEAVQSHIEQCDDCRKRVGTMSADSFLVRIREAQAGQSQFGQSLNAGSLSFKPSPAPPPANTLPPGLADNPDY